MWILVVQLVHSQLNHLFFRKRENEEEKGEREEKRTEREEDKTRKKKKDKKMQREEEQTFFFSPLGILPEGLAGFASGSLALYRFWIYISLKTGCLQSRGNNPEPPINQ